MGGQFAFVDGGREWMAVGDGAGGVGGEALNGEANGMAEGLKWEVNAGGNVGVDEACKLLKAFDFMGDV